MKVFMYSVKWLKIVSLLFCIFGIFLALFNQTALFTELFANQINRVFYNDAKLTYEGILFQRWIYGLLGATCLMVGILVYSIVKYAYAKKEKWAWNSIILAVFAWFIIDTPISIMFNVYFNVIFNTVLLVAVCIPLLITRKYFYT